MSIHRQKVSMKKKLYRFVSLFTVINLVVEIFFPAVSYALTSGPSQPEHVQFAPVGANNSVDLFSGDFSYNIPLFELPGPDGGYPFNLTYQAGVGVEEEASWVGLGWNLTPGAINRQMRGLPDEFKGDTIRQKIERKANTTVSFSPGANLALELFGYEKDKANKLRSIFKNTPLGGVNLSGGLSLSIRYNNYTGMGYSFTPTFSYGMDVVQSNLTNVGIGVGRSHNLTIDSENGITGGNNNTINFNLSGGASQEYKEIDTEHGKSGTIIASQINAKLGFSSGTQYNSRQGLLSEGYGLSTSLGKSKTNILSRRTTNSSVGLSGNWSLDYTNNGYMPSIATPTLVSSVSFLAKVGLPPKGIYGGNFNISGTLTTQNIRYDDVNNNSITNRAYGYNHSEEKKGLMDINRERDKIIHKETKTLPAPNFTYDTYMVTGQGLTGMFRPYRGEIGVLGDNYAKSITRSVAAGADVAVPILPSTDYHIGINLEYTGGSSVSTRDTQIGKYGFKERKEGSMHEPLYYKFQGEASIKPINSLEKIGNHIPVRFELNDDGSVQDDNITYSQVESDISNDNSNISSLATATMNSTVITTKTATLNPYFNQGRDSRNTLIQEVTNEYADYLPEYTIEYTEGTTENEKLYRDKQDTDESKELTKHLETHHLAGFTCLNAGGSRYIYGLPAYNYEQFEVVRSTDKSSNNDSHLSKLDSIGNLGSGERYSSRTKTPAYPYAYLLTSILGTDYIDVDYNEDEGRGISKNDLGYWVKFGYQRVHNDYDWRSPYTGVNFTEGLHGTNADDKVSYAFGKKDIFYVQKVETKSHIAIFYTSDRKDAISSNAINSDDENVEESNGTGSVGTKKLKRLDRIALFTRAEYEANQDAGTPIKEIHFDYEYELCSGIPNVLEEDNGIGKLTLKKIWFTYQGVNRGKLSPYEFEYYNANYPVNYSSSNPILAIPQISQDRWGVFAPRGGSPEYKTHASFPYVDQTLTETQRTDNVSAWNLKEIKMPTGSRMRIEYESDDYAYVQDKKAMQMYPFSVEGNPFISSSEETLSDTQLRIYFKLQENDIEDASQVGLTEEQAAKIVNRYLDGREQVYVKTLIGLRENKDFEDMSAYLDIKPIVEEGIYTRGINQASGNYYGYITLKPAIDTKGRSYNPLTVAAWIKLKTEHSRLLLTNNEMNDNVSNPDWNQLTKFISTFQAVREIRGNYYDIAKDRKWGRKIKHQYSYIKLNNTKGYKYGGGYRVKSVEFWDGTGADYNSQSTYGQVYDYTTKENGKTISSGVASYEPLTGGDENALRYAEKYIKDIPGKSKHAMGLTGYEFYVEYPVNEGYYPGAKIGYSKVTVKSLATAKKIEQINEFKDVSTTGLTINEFYTTRDFPTLAAQTDIDHQEDQRTTHSLFPFYTKVKRSAGMSQGFVVEVNNMDGKPKAMYHYGQNDKGEVLYDKPISSSEYFYKTKQRGKHQVLDNLCKVLVEEKNGVIKKEERLVGVEYDVFIDSRRSNTKTTRAGGNFNTTLISIEVLPTPITIPSLFFSSSTEEESLNIITINKVIYHSGILDYVKVSDGLSTSTTQNLLWDANTGGVLLTSVNNNFDNKIYSYTIPAYTQYDEMGAAYRNIGLEFEVNARYVNGGRMYNLEAPIPNELWTDELVAGDELIIDCKQGYGLRKAIYMGADRTTQRFQFFVLDPLPTDFVGKIEGIIMRSGRRNLLAASAGNITSLKDPTENRTQKTFAGKSTITKEK